MNSRRFLRATPWAAGRPSRIRHTARQPAIGCGPHRDSLELSVRHGSHTWGRLSTPACSNARWGLPGARTRDHLNSSDARGFAGLVRCAARNENFVRVVEPHNGLERATGEPRRPPSGEALRRASPELQRRPERSGALGPRERRRWGVRPAVARRVWNRALARSRRSLGEGGRSEAPRSSGLGRATGRATLGARRRRSGAGLWGPASDGDGGSGPPSPDAYGTGLWRGLAGALAKADEAKPPGRAD